MAGSPFLHSRCHICVLAVCERCSLQPGVLLEMVESLRGSALLDLCGYMNRDMSLSRERDSFLLVASLLFLPLLPSSLSLLLSFFINIFIFCPTPCIALYPKQWIQSTQRVQWSELSDTTSQNKPFVLLNKFCLKKKPVHNDFCHFHSPFSFLVCCNLSSLTFLPSFSVWATEFNQIFFRNMAGGVTYQNKGNIAVATI